MNIIRDLRKKKGIQQKELASAIKVSIPAISNWENGKCDPTGEHLKMLADYFGVDEMFILGYGQEKPNAFVPENPKISGVSETEQIVQHVLEKLNIVDQPEIKTPEARILAKGIDKLPKEQREQALNVVKAMFVQYQDLF